MVDDSITDSIAKNPDPHNDYFQDLSAIRMQMGLTQCLWIRYYTDENLLTEYFKTTVKSPSIKKVLDKFWASHQNAILGHLHGT